MGEHQITLLMVWARVVQIMHSIKPMYTPAVCFVCVCGGGGGQIVDMHVTFQYIIEMYINKLVYTITIP